MLALLLHVKKIIRGTLHPGKGGASIWSQADLLTDFVYPWDSAAAPATSFAALWDGEWLYGLYRVKDDRVVMPILVGAGAHDMYTRLPNVFHRPGSGGVVHAFKYPVDLTIGSSDKPVDGNGHFQDQLSHFLSF